MQLKCYLRELDTMQLDEDGRVGFQTVFVCFMSREEVVAFCMNMGEDGSMLFETKEKK